MSVVARVCGLSATVRVRVETRKLGRDRVGMVPDKRPTEHDVLELRLYKVTGRACH